MQPPVNLDDLLSMWSKDAVIDELHIDKELLRIGALKAKYLMILSHHNIKAKSLEKEHNKLKLIKWDYFKGDLNNTEDLKKYGFEPWSKTTIRQDIPMRLDADKELNNILIKKLMNEEIVDVCKEIIKELNNRTYQIRGYIDYKKFMDGNN